MNGTVTSAQSLWLWLYVACMAAGAIAIMVLSRDPKGVPHYEYAAAAFIPVWSGLAYMAMALGQGVVEVGGREIFVARYADWIVTTPLLLAGLAWTAMFYTRKHVSLIVTLLGADVIMILSGLFADLTDREAIKWLWYAIGCLCLAIIFWVAWGPLRRIAESQGPEVAATYKRVAGFLAILWVGYPTVWALSPSGLGLIGDTATVALFVVLPVVSKVGFSLYDITELRKLGARRPAPSSEAYPA